MGFLNNLTAAGVISGAGKALERSLDEGQKFEIQKALEQGRQDMENLRQERLLDAQRSMHAETLATTREEGAATRASHESVVGKQIEATHAEGEATRGTHLVQAGMQMQTTKEEGAATRKSHEDIAAAQSAAVKAIHDADRSLKKYEIDITEKTSRETVTAKALAEVGNEITRLSVIAKDPMLDKASPEYKMITERLKRLERLHDAYSSVLRPKGYEDKVAMAPKQAPIVDPFSGKIKPEVTPEVAPVTPASPSIELPPVRRGGLIQVPPPSEAEQELMRRSLQE